MMVICSGEIDHVALESTLKIYNDRSYIWSWCYGVMSWRRLDVRESCCDVVIVIDMLVYSLGVKNS